MASNQQKYKTYGLWKKLFRQSNVKEFRGSIHRDAAMLDRIATDIGYDELEELIRYYFKVKDRGHNLLWFNYNYDKLRDARDAYKKDEARRAEIRRKTRERMEARRNDESRS